MKTIKQIKNKIKSIEDDIVELNHLIMEINDPYIKLTYLAAKGSAKKQLKLLKWVVK